MSDCTATGTCSHWLVPDRLVCNLPAGHSGDTHWDEAQEVEWHKK
jgi:hypothetical protein